MLTTEEPGDAARRHRWPTFPGQVDGLPALRRHVVLHPGDVVSVNSLHHNETILSARYAVKSILLRPVATQRSTVTITTSVNKRRVFLADLGKYLVGLRKARGWKQAQAADIAKRRGIPLSYQALRGLEKGETKDPDPAQLRALSMLYGVPYAEMVSRFIELRYEVALGYVPQDGSLSPARGSFQAPNPPAFQYVALMRDRIAAGQPLAIDDENVDGAMAFSAKFLKKLKRPVCVRVGQKEQSMAPIITPGDIVLLECDDAARVDPEISGIYAVRDDNGATLKRVELVKQSGRVWLALVSENKAFPARIIPVAEDQSVLDYIIGRVVWHGQYV